MTSPSLSSPGSSFGSSSEAALDLSVRIGSLALKNPVTVASGTYGYGTEYADFYDPGLLGGMFLKGLTLEDRPGNPPARLVETPSGLMNAIGLQNVGYRNFLDEKLPHVEHLPTAIIANVCGESIEEYVQITEALAEYPRIDGIELNISCPNVKKGCIQFGSDPVQTEAVTRATVAATDLPVIVKLSPNVGSIAEMASAAEAGGAAGLSVINTIVALAIDIKTRKPKIANVTGGLSGPAIRPIAVRMVWEVFQAVKIPIVGMGGITTAEDALEFIIAGASAVSIGTANFVHPRAPIDVLEGIERYLRENNLKSVRELVGTLEVA